jgi:hypothetical protein
VNLLNWAKGVPNINIRIRNNELRIKNGLIVIFFDFRNKISQNNVKPIPNPRKPERDFVKISAEKNARGSR